MKTRNFILVMMLVLAMVCLAACGGADTPADTDTTDTGDQVEARNFKLATLATPDTSFYKRIEDFINTVEEQTNGEITFTLYPADQLGDYSLVYEELMKGNVEFSVNSIPSTYDQRADALYIYYLAADYDQLAYYYGPDSSLYALMDEITAERGIKFFGFDCQGMGGMGFTKEVTDYNIIGADKKTVARVSPTDICRIWMESIGYTVVSLNYGELYSALQTGVVEGWIGGNPTYNYNSFRDAIKYYYQSNDLTEMCSYMCNQEIWDSLTPEQQTIIDEAADANFLRSIEECKVDDQMYRDQMEDYGITVIYYTPEELAEFADYCRYTVWPQAVDAFTQEVLDNLYADIDAYEAMNATDAEAEVVAE